MENKDVRRDVLCENLDLGSYVANKTRENKVNNNHTVKTRQFIWLAYATGENGERAFTVIENRDYNEKCSGMEIEKLPNINPQNPNLHGSDPNLQSNTNGSTKFRCSHLPVYGSYSGFSDRHPGLNTRH